jgi:hypothetical protein
MQVALACHNRLKLGPGIRGRTRSLLSELPSRKSLSFLNLGDIMTLQSNHPTFLLIFHRCNKVANVIK